MSLGIKILVLSSAITATVVLAGQRLQIAIPNTPVAARQIAYYMRAYHNFAVQFKSANPNLTGILPVTVPAYFTDNRFAACADAKSVVTWTTGVNALASTAVQTELQRQAVFPPTQVTWFTLPGGYGNSVTAASARAPGMGLALAAVGGRQTAATDYGSLPMPAGCLVPSGSLIILTQVSP